MKKQKNTASKPSLLALIAASAFLPVAAQAELVFTVGVLSDYVDSGESLSGNLPVVQGGVEFAHASSVNVGLHISSLFGSLRNEQEELSSAGQELTSTIGYGFSVGELDVAASYEWVAYPEIEHANAGELIFGVGFQAVAMEVGYTVQADQRDEQGSMTFSIAANRVVADDTGLTLTLGYDDPNQGEGVTYWLVSLTRGAGMGEISLSYASRDEADAQHLFAVGYHTSF